MIMTAAPRIEPGAAGRACVLAFEIVPDAQLGATCAAHDRWRVPFGSRPNLDRVARKRVVAVLAGVIDSAALHPDGDNVQRRMPMRTACFVVQIDAANNGTHRSVRCNHMR